MSSDSSSTPMSKIPSGGSWPGPPACSYDSRLYPASSRILFVIGFVHSACVSQYGKSMYDVAASGDVVEPADAIQFDPRVWQPPVVSLASGAPSQRVWYSWEKLMRFFWVSCAEARIWYIARPCDWRAGRLASLTQSHRERLPALALATMPSTAVCVFSLR